MPSDFSFTEYIVTCHCGAEWTIANPEMQDHLTCSICGCKFEVTEENVHPKQIPATETVAQAARVASPTSQQLHDAIALVRQGRFTEALNLYKAVLGRDYENRDAFYGMGYAYWKLGRHRESCMVLSLAHEMGHPAAKKLLDRVNQSLESRKHSSRT